MRPPFVCLVVAIGMVILATGACAPAAPAPTAVPATKAAEPTKAPAAAPAKAPEPTKAPAAQPTAAPAPKKVIFPEKGKAIEIVVGVAPGGGTDITARVLAEPLEKVLGTPVQILNKSGAGSLVGTTYVAKAKPDGYTVGYNNWPNIIPLYLDPEYKATFGRKDLQAVARHVVDPATFAVRIDSPIRNLKDLVDAARAKPNEIKVGVTGIMNTQHMALLQLEKVAGVKFNTVIFEGVAQVTPALIGGHIDVAAQSLAASMVGVKGGQQHVITTIVAGGEEFLPEAKTMAQQGYPEGFFGLDRGLFVPAGTPREIVDILAEGVKKAIETEEHKKKARDQAMTAAYMGPDEFGAYWDKMEGTVKVLMALAKEQRQ